MDEKTEELRDLFMDVTDSDTVTESQEETPGSLVGDDGGNVDERIERVIERMRERYEFESALDDDELRELVRCFYEGESDGEIASDLDVSPSTVFRARMDLHLLRESDEDAPFDLVALRDREDESTADLAEEFDASEATVERYRRVLRTRDEVHRANQRFRDEFDSVLADSDISGRLTEDAREDGLEDATEGMETDVSF